MPGANLLRKPEQPSHPDPDPAKQISRTPVDALRCRKTSSKIPSAISLARLQPHGHQGEEFDNLPVDALIGKSSQEGR